MWWLGFWIFLSIFTICECYLYSQGHETALWKHKTTWEQEHQKAMLEKVKGE